MLELVSTRHDSVAPRSSGSARECGSGERYTDAGGDGVVSVYMEERRMKSVENLSLYSQQVMNPEDA